jgi:hypothetical protein
VLTTNGSTITVARSSLGGLTPNGPLRKPALFPVGQAMTSKKPDWMSDHRPYELGVKFQ